MSNLQMKTLVLEVLDSIFIDRFLLVAFVKYILSQIYNHCIQNFTFWYFMEIVETFAFWRKYFQILLYLFFYQKPVTSITQEWLVVESCLTPQWITFSMFYRLIYILFKWPDFRLKCLVTITPKARSLKFKASVWNIPISETGRNCNSLLSLLMIIELLSWNRKERWGTVGLVLFELNNFAVTSPHWINPETWLVYRHSTGVLFCLFALFKKFRS